MTNLTYLYYLSNMWRQPLKKMQLFDKMLSFQNISIDIYYTYDIPIAKHYNILSCLQVILPDQNIMTYRNIFTWSGKSVASISSNILLLQILKRNSSLLIL